MPIRRFAAILAFGVTLLASPACGREEPPPAAPVAIAVTVQPARLETLRDVVSVPGTVVVSAMADFVVVASESAEIAELPHAEGDKVREGEVLVRFEIPALTTNLLARQVEVAEAASRLETLRADLARLSGYYDKGIVARNLVDAARAAVAGGETALNQAKTALDASKGLSERALIRARFSGTVIKVWHRAGDIAVADSADPILRMVDPSRTQVSIQVPATQPDRVAPGRTATITPATGPAEPAAVSSRSAPAPGATTVDVRLTFLAPSALLVDAPVQVEVLIDERHDVVVVSESAVVRDAGAAFVWVAKPDNHAERREVRVGLTINGLSQVLSGVSPGERIIMTGLAQLQDGVAVTVSR